jgi:hypothetical protein
MTLLIIVVILCPLMLCVKPCVAGCTYKEHEDEEIEFVNINRGDGEEDAMMGVDAMREAINADMMGSDELINKRQSEMKDLEK